MKKEEKLKFKKLFGVESGQLGKSVIISPFLSPKLLTPYLKNTGYFKGLLFQGISGEYKGKRISFVRTGIGHTLVSDCLYAQDAAYVRRALFLGAVGAVKDFDIGRCVLVKEACFDIGFFERIDGVKHCFRPTRFYRADAALLKTAENMFKKQKDNTQPVRLSTLNSLLNQDEDLISELKARQIDAVDLECALFYAVAGDKKIPALALGYVSDQLISKPYWQERSINEQVQVKKSVFLIIRSALELCVSA
ncbi:MAG: hypothetical protein KKB82_06035 [Candidatus Omnitrophica bacterium]|nr:hypothetical protein [Candidatus Omnitrophota bacterium]MBU1925461.1 hypothetical protein [Candidatus Omnitrophota bacterium]